MRLRRDEPGCYILAAVVADTAACETARDVLRALLLKSQRRLHWRDESAPRRQQIIDCVSDTGVRAVVVAGSPVERTKQERARRVCMERLLYELHAMDVAHVLLESRTPPLNQRDAAMVAAMRTNGTISDRLWVEHRRPLREPMLWAADAVAGAVASTRFGEERYACLERLGKIIDIAVR
jgi:hypothetical protein